MSDPILDEKHKYLDDLIHDLHSVYTQLSQTLDETHRTRPKRTIAALETEIRQMYYFLCIYQMV